MLENVESFPSVTDACVEFCWLRTISTEHNCAILRLSFFVVLGLLFCGEVHCLGFVCVVGFG